MHLIKKDKNLNNYIQVFSSINEFSHIIGKYSLQYLTHNLTNRGNIVVAYERGPKKRTSIGNSPRSRPKNKHKRRQHTRSRGQG